MATKQDSGHILSKEELRSQLLKKTNVLKKQLAAPVPYSTQFAGFTPTLAGRSSNDSVTIRNVGRINVRDASGVELSMRKILSVRVPNRLVVLIRSNDFESSLFEPEVKPTSTRKQRYEVHYSQE